MSCSNPIHVLFLFLLIFCTTKFSYCTTPCPNIEKQALLTFKQSLHDPSNLLSSWNPHLQPNCCNWNRVVCSNATGHVRRLHLQNRDPFSSEGLRGLINPSLLHLKHLTYLDLSQNNFNATVPSFMGYLTSLEHLNLSRAGFRGMIPHTLGNLSRLHTLSLEDFYQRVLDVNTDTQFYDQSLLEADSLQWLRRLSQLERLHMNGVNLSRAAGSWAQAINALPSLLELRLSSCSLNFIQSLPHHANNITSLAILDLSANDFDSFAIPGWIFQPTTLLFLDLSWNNFRGPIPAASNTTKLQHMDLSYNYYLNSSIPDWLYFNRHLQFVSFDSNSLQSVITSAVANLTSLTTLRFSDNQLSGKIPREIANLCRLQILDLSFNNLQGEISESLVNMSDCFLQSLQYLSLRRNQLSGKMTDELGKLKSLQELHLGFNRLTGNLPATMGKLFNLISLDIEGNKLAGVVTATNFANTTSLQEFHASGNHLTMIVSKNWIAPFELVALEMRSWSFGEGSPIPSWIQLQKNIIHLDLSDTGISGNVPAWFWGIRFLNLSHNHLQGKIPDLNDISAHLIYLSSNKFSGSLPGALSDAVMELDLSNNSLSGGLYRFMCNMNETSGLQILHLGGNRLTGDLPDCLMKWPFLRYLNLGDNRMSGRIPNSIGFLTNLRSLNLYGNRFSGQIPYSMSSCTELQKIDLQGNYLGGKMPAWMGTSLSNLRFLILRSNKFVGEFSPDMCHLNSLQILDLSDNSLVGVIPRCIHNFTAMATKRSLDINGELEFSSYVGESFKESASIATKGGDYQYDTILPLVTDMDLSDNNLSGEIPEEITRLAELGSLNLSGNHLTGMIPSDIGDMKQLESLDLSRNSLSGEIPDSFTAMSSLSYLNVSYNNLTGRIPESTQMRTMSASSFIGNNLCGLPLPRKCSGDDDDEAQGGLHKEDNERSKVGGEYWFYVLLSLGYAVGLSGFCTVFILKKSWREAYFGMVELVWNKFYVYFHCKWARLTRRAL